MTKHERALKQIDVFWENGVLTASKQTDNGVGDEDNNNENSDVYYIYISYYQIW